MNGEAEIQNSDSRSVSVAGLTIAPSDVQSAVGETKPLKTPKNAIRWWGVATLMLMLISASVMLFVSWSLYRIVVWGAS